MTQPSTPLSEELATCTWTLDDRDSKWDTECNKAFQFEADGPEENGLKFCPFCGKSLVVIIPERCTFCNSKDHDSSDCDEADESVDEHLNED